MEVCSLCAEYPCDDIMEFDRDKYVHHKSVLPNGRRIAEIGLQPWLEEQKERWSCVECGTAFTWFEGNCPSCGAQLFNVQAEFGDSKN